MVRTIFEMYASGQSLGSILKWLNTSATSAPADGWTKKTTGPGWSKNLLHGMLRNERYVGEFVWNRRKWVKDPTTGKRRSVRRPESEWVRRKRPELAIVSSSLWASVQERHRTNSRRSGNGRRGYYEHILSGLLRCGSCGSPMSIVSRQMKAGVPYSQFGYSARHAKGDAACSNSTTISEKRLEGAVLQKLREHFASPKVEEWLAEALQAAERAHSRTGKEQDEFARLEAEVRAQEGRVDKVTEALGPHRLLRPARPEAQDRGGEASSAPVLGPCDGPEPAGDPRDAEGHRSSAGRRP